MPDAIEQPFSMAARVARAFAASPVANTIRLSAAAFGFVLPNVV